MRVAECFGRLRISNFLYMICCYFPYTLLNNDDIVPINCIYYIFLVFYML